MNVIYAIIAGIGFGFAMFFRKLSVGQIGTSGFIWESIIEAILALVLVFLLFPIDFSQITSKPLGVFYGIAGGISIGLGVLAFFISARTGPALIPSILGPVLSASTGSILAIILLHESLSPLKLFGLILSLTGLFIFLR